MAGIITCARNWFSAPLKCKFVRARKFLFLIVLCTMNFYESRGRHPTIISNGGGREAAERWGKLHSTPYYSEGQKPSHGRSSQEEMNLEDLEDQSKIKRKFSVYFNLILCLNFKPIQWGCGPFILGGRFWNPWSQFCQINVPPRFISFGPLIIFLP